LKNKELTYIGLLLIHIFFGVIVFFVPFLAKLCSVLIVLFGILLIFKTKNRNNEALLISSYVVGIEVFLRMTEGNPIHELSKYLVILFLIFGMYYRGFSKSSFIYIVFLLLLVPGIIIGANELNFDTNIRKAIAFNISGPICLAIASIYCYNNSVTFNFLNKLFVYIGMPIISMTTYLFLYTPSVKDVITGTQSNFETSGGFGPNQVSTILGLGMFVFFTLFLIFSKTKKEIILNIIIVLIMFFRGIVTFSRGGIITAVIMVILLMLITYIYSNKLAKTKLITIILFSIIGGILVWTYSVIQTNGMIENRYANQDARGRVKEDRLGGREKIAKTEIQMFLDNPIVGIGVAKNKEYRQDMLGVGVVSHNELTRMLAEHGLLGVIGLLILIITPLLLLVNDKQNIFLLSFFVFWALTINHAAMRTAAPAFVYALSLLKVKITDEKTPVIHRE